MAIHIIPKPCEPPVIRKLISSAMIMSGPVIKNKVIFLVRLINTKVMNIIIEYNKETITIP